MPSCHPVLRKCYAFTLAELLITLGIIGIVAALTMPSLIENHQKKVTAARVKKFYSTMSQAIKLSELENGSCDTWYEEEPEFNLDDPDEFEQHSNFVKNYLNKYFVKYLKNVTIENAKLVEGYHYGDLSLVFPDGGRALIDINEYRIGMFFITDRNIRNSLDIEIKCNPKSCFYFSAPTKNSIEEYNELSSSDFIIPSNRKCMLGAYPTMYYIHAYLVTERNSLKSWCHKKEEACTRLLMDDGWEFKDDYPWHIKVFDRSS